MNIGFIGTGVMGKSMAANLMNGGHQLTVYNRTPEKAQALIERGAKWANSAGECAKDQDVVITMVGDPDDVRDVYLSAGGILDSAREGAYVIDMTTTSPALWLAISTEARKRGLKPLDAPVSGGDTGAKSATLSIMVGGDAADVDACRPIFALMGKTIVHVGGASCGQHTKMANQIAIAGAIAGVAEAVRYGEACHLDMETVLSCISAGAAGSWQMSNNGPKMLSGDDAPGFFIKHFLKDMRIAMAEALVHSAHLPVLAAVYERYEQMEEEGEGDLGTQALIRLYRRY